MPVKARLKLGFAPWTEITRCGKPEYYLLRNQLTELLTNYGPIFSMV
jgi:hypothetical protein